MPLDLHLMLIVKQPPFSYMKNSLIFISYFRRLYKGTLPSLVTSSYLLRTFNFNDCHYDKNCVLHIIVTFAMPTSPNMKYNPCFHLLFSQMAHSYITCRSKTINSSSSSRYFVGGDLDI